MTTAIVHDWLVTYAGAERVLEQMLVLYPEADVYTLIDFMPESERTFLGQRAIRTSFLQRLPGMRRGYRRFLPLMPLAIEQFDLSAYELVLSSSYAVAKGVLTGPDQLHVCYCHSPMRYAWDLQSQYLRVSGLDRGVRSWLARYLLHRIRLWDHRTANGVDEFIANSEFVARRIRKFYRRDAVVIHPPVDIETFTPGGVRQDFYVAASRMVPYKRMDLVVEAFASMPHRHLVVIGDGPEVARISALGGPNVRMLGYQPQAVLRNYLQQARAFVFAGEEDFGIAPVEALACGTPVIAYGKGGVLETVDDSNHRSPTGVFFSQQTAGAIREAVERFESEEQRFSPVACRTSALRFSAETFRGRFQEYLDSALERFRRRRSIGGAGKLDD
jgi:glycosyltransferase involved in cell wall biosynthesis